jgi:hypothetical protein
MKYMIIAIVEGKVVSKLEIDSPKFLGHLEFPRAYFGADKIHYIMSDKAADLALKLEGMVNAGSVEEEVYDEWTSFLDDIFEACEMSGANAAMLVCVTE